MPPRRCTWLGLGLGVGLGCTGFRSQPQPPLSRNLPWLICIGWSKVWLGSGLGVGARAGARAGARVRVRFRLRVRLRLRVGVRVRVRVTASAGRRSGSLCATMIRSQGSGGGRRLLLTLTYHLTDLTYSLTDLVVERDHRGARIPEWVRRHVARVDAARLGRVGFGLELG